MHKHIVFLLFLFCSISSIQSMDADGTTPDSDGATVAAVAVTPDGQPPAYAGAQMYHNPMRTGDDDCVTLEDDDHAQLVAPLAAVKVKKKPLSQATKQAREHLCMLLNTYYKYSDKQGVFERQGFVARQTRQMRQFEQAVDTYVNFLHTQKPEKDRQELQTWFINLPDKEGNRAVHKVAENFDVPWLNFLVTRLHATLNCKNKKKQTPSTVAHSKVFSTASKESKTAYPTEQIKRKKKKEVTQAATEAVLMERYNAFLAAYSKLVASQQKDKQ